MLTLVINIISNYLSHYYLNYGFTPQVILLDKLNIIFQICGSKRPHVAVLPIATLLYKVSSFKIKDVQMFATSATVDHHTGNNNKILHT